MNNGKGQFVIKKQNKIKAMAENIWCQASMCELGLDFGLRL